jgi:hypothetical protein
LPQLLQLLRQVVGNQPPEPPWTRWQRRVFHFQPIKNLWFKTGQADNRVAPFGFIFSCPPALLKYDARNLIQQIQPPL